MNLTMEYRRVPFGEVGGNFFDYKKNCIYELIDKQYTSTVIKDRRKAGVDKVFELCREYVKSGCSFRLVMKVLDKKLQMVMNSNNQREIEDILKLSTPQYLKNGFVVTSKYHIPEEELLLLMMANKMGNLKGVAKERFICLYNAFVKTGKPIEEVLEGEDEL